MVVGVLRLELLLPETHSLKGKRSILRSIKARVQQKFNVSIAECEDHDLWQRTILGVSQVGADQPHVDRCLREVVSFIDGLHLAEVGEEQLEFLHRSAGRGPGVRVTPALTFEYDTTPDTARRVNELLRSVRHDDDEGESS